MAAVSRFCLFASTLRRCSHVFHDGIQASSEKINLTLKRGYKRYHKSYLSEMSNRKKKEIPVARPRSAWIDWNRKAEIYAFGKRLNEDFREDTINAALTHISYVHKENRKRAELSLSTENTPLNIADNSQLSALGHNVMSQYIKAFLRYSLPYFPEEGVRDIHDYLVTDDLLGYIAENLGFKDLILSGDYPPSKLVLAETFKAIIGAICQDKNVEKAEVFVCDFVLTQLVDKDVNGFWKIINPMGLLADILSRDGQSQPEPRLLREAGRNTLFAVYEIGLYVDENLVGSGYGETLVIAEEMAARDALKRLFRTTDARTPFPFGGQPKLTTHTTPNLSIDDWMSKKADEVASKQLKQYHNE